MLCVKELLEKVLKIDARIDLPESSEFQVKHDDPGGGGDEGGGRDGGGGKPADDIMQQPPKKRYKECKEGKENHDPPRGGGGSGPDDNADVVHSIISEAIDISDHSIAAIIAPHKNPDEPKDEVMPSSPSSDDDVAEILKGSEELENSEGKLDKDIIIDICAFLTFLFYSYLVTPDVETKIEVNKLLESLECKYCDKKFSKDSELEDHLFEHLSSNEQPKSPQLFEAPKIISKHTGGPRRNPRIPQAPKVVSKHTSDVFRVKKAQAMAKKSKPPPLSVSPLPSTSKVSASTSNGLKIAPPVSSSPQPSTSKLPDSVLNEAVGVTSSPSVSPQPSTSKAPDLASNDLGVIPPPSVSPQPSTSKASDFTPTTNDLWISAGRLTRSKTGSAHVQPSYIENNFDDDDDEDIFDFDEFNRQLIENLPPPLPQPPEPGMVILGGEWVTQKQANKVRAARQTNPQNNAKVRKYNYKPTMYTISGKSKEETFAAANEADGEFPCPYEGCTLIYARERSLKVHISRNHHDALKASCPECGKKLSCPAAISKHLLSHRPREFWPYFCPLCGRKFQAKGDLPKHFLTKLHVNEVPEVGSPAWKALCDQGVCAPQMSWRKNLQTLPTPQVPTNSTPTVNNESQTSTVTSTSPDTQTSGVKSTPTVTNEDVKNAKSNPSKNTSSPKPSTSNSALLKIKEELTNSTLNNSVANVIQAPDAVVASDAVMSSNSPLYNEHGEEDILGEDNKMDFDAGPTKLENFSK